MSHAHTHTPPEWSRLPTAHELYWFSFVPPALTAAVLLTLNRLIFCHAMRLWDRLCKRDRAQQCFRSICISVIIGRLGPLISLHLGSVHTSRSRTTWGAELSDIYCSAWRSVKEVWVCLRLQMRPLRLDPNPSVFCRVAVFLIPWFIPLHLPLCVELKALIL